MCYKPLFFVSMRSLHFSFLELKGLFYKLCVLSHLFFSISLNFTVKFFLLLGVSGWFLWWILKPMFKKQNLGLMIIGAACISRELTFPPKNC